VVEAKAVVDFLIFKRRGYYLRGFEFYYVNPKFNGLIPKWSVAEVLVLSLVYPMELGADYYKKGCITGLTMRPGISYLFCEGLAGGGFFSSLTPGRFSSLFFLNKETSY